MRGLASIPSLAEREKVYSILEDDFRQTQKCGKSKITSDQWVLWSQWTRFDPRLGEIWVKTFSIVWRSLSPLQMREAVLSQPWPACMGVLLHQVNSHFLTVGTRPLFRSWSKLVMEGVPKAENEFYFIGVFSFAGSRVQKDVESSFKNISRWGFLGQVSFLNKASGKPFKTEVGVTQRRSMLDLLIANHSRLTVDQYISALPQGVGIRQAQMDLANHPRLKAVGRTRGRFYLRKR